MTQEQSANLKIVQMVYGIALVAAGIGLFFKTAEVLQKVSTFPILANSEWFSKFCIYLMGIILIGGGSQKIFRYIKSNQSESSDNPAEHSDD